MTKAELQEYKDLLSSNEFQDAIRRKRVCLFLGAGVAKNLGMPSWQELASKIANCCLEKNILKYSSIHILNLLNDPLKIISYCVSKIKESKNDKYLDDILKHNFSEIPENNYEETSIYKDFVELYKSGKILIVQTNYDNTIAHKCGIQTLQTYVPYLDEPKNGLDNSLLVYLHGKIDEAPLRGSTLSGDLILTRSDYNNVYVNKNDSRYEKQQNFIKLLLSNYHVIFLGYSLQDNEIIQLIANSGEVEGYLRTSVIVDSCGAKEIQNEITAKYLSDFSNGKLELYYYDTEEYGIEKNFENVMKNLKETILSEPKLTNLQGFQDGKGVIFG